MRRGLLPIVLAALWVAPLFAEEGGPAAPKADAPAQQAETMGLVIREPRTVDSMARFWAVLCDACELAKVPPSEVLVLDVKRVSQRSTNGNVVHLDSAGMRQPKNWYASPHAAELGVEYRYFPQLVEAMAQLCGNPTMYFPPLQQFPRALFVGRDVEQFTATWQYVFSWRDTYKLAKDKMLPGGESLGALRADGAWTTYEVQEIQLAAQVKKAEMTPELLAVSQKWGFVPMPVK